MLQITETSHNGHVKTWTAHDKNDFINLVTDSFYRSRPDQTLYAAKSAGEVYNDIYDVEEYSYQQFLALNKLPSDLPQETVIYQAYWCHTGFSLEDPGRYKACMEWLRRDLQSLEVEDLGEGR